MLKTRLQVLAAGCALLLVLAGLLLSPTARGAGSDPSTLSRKIIDQLFLLQAPAQGSELSGDQRRINEEALAQIDQLAHLETMAQRALEPLRDKMSEAQRARARTSFEAILRATSLPSIGNGLQEGPVTVEATAVDDEMTRIKVGLPGSKPGDAEIVLIWRRLEGTWQVWDIEVDGDSLVLDYQNQFARIMTSDGPEGLLERLDKKRAELEASRVADP